MERWLEGAWTAFQDIYNLTENEYFFFDEGFLRERIQTFDADLDEMAWLARGQTVVRGAELPDPGGKASLVIGNFYKSCYLPFLCSQIANQSFPADRYEVIFVDSADDPAFLPVVRWCHQRWPQLEIRAFETHEDRTKTVTTRRNVGARNARNDTLVIFDADWLPVGREFLTNIFRARAGRTVVRATVFLAHIGTQHYGRWLRGPDKWFHPLETQWQIVPSPPMRMIRERSDHDFVLAIGRDDYWESRGFSEECIGGSGIEDAFFGHAISGVGRTWCLDAFACALDPLCTHVAAEKSHPATLVPAPTKRNGDDWGNPSTLEDLTNLL